LYSALRIDDLRTRIVGGVIGTAVGVDYNKEMKQTFELFFP